MANTVLVRKLHDGPSNVVVHVSLESDGVSGEVENLQIMEGSRFSIQQVMGGISGFDVALSFDDFADVPALTITPETCKQDYRKIGGVPDPGGLDSKKKLLLSTSGFTAAGDRGSLTITARKKG